MSDVRGPIVVPLDTSVFGSNALPLARALALQSGASVHLVRVDSPVEAWAAPGASPDPGAPRVRRIRDSWESTLDDVGRYFLARLGRLRVRTALLEGRRVDSLVAYARAHSAGIVVMAANGVRADGYARGVSIAAQVGREAAVPVLLIHPEAVTAEYGAERRCERILVALGGSEVDAELVSAAASLAATGPLHLTLAHVVPSPRAASGAADYVREHAERLGGRGHFVETRVIVGDRPAAALGSAAAEARAELLVVGARRRETSAGTGYGKVTASLFRDLSLPMLVVSHSRRRVAWDDAA